MWYIAGKYRIEVIRNFTNGTDIWIMVDIVAVQKVNVDVSWV